MKRGALGAAVVVVAALLGVAVWALQRNRATEESRGAVFRPVQQLPAAPVLPVPDEPGGSTSLVEDVALPTEPAAEPPAGPSVSTLRVFVVDELRLPIAGAQVVVKARWRERFVTDTEGVALVTAPPASEVDLLARHPDYRFKLLHAVVPDAGAPPGEATIVLTKELTACVHITDDRGFDLAGAEVTFREIKIKGQNYLGSFLGTRDELEEFFMADQFDGTFQESRVSDGTGSCCVSGITAGIVAISVRAEGFVYMNQRNFELGPRGGDLGTIQLERALTLAGTVVDGAGPVPGARVTLFGAARESDTTTNAEGCFTFSTLPPSLRWITLRVSHPTRGDFFDPRLVLTAEPLVIVLQSSLDVTLRLRDADTQLLLQGDCTLTRVLPPGGEMLRWSLPKTMTLENGEVHAGWVPYYAAGLQVEAPNYARTVVALPALQAGAGAPVEVLLVRGGTIAIRAIDGATGLPVLKARVTGSHFTHGSRLGTYFLIKAPFDEASGAYIVDTSAFTFEPGFDETVSVAAPDGRSSPEFPVSTNGVRVCGTTIEVVLPRK